MFNRFAPGKRLVHKYPKAALSYTKFARKWLVWSWCPMNGWESIDYTGIRFLTGDIKVDVENTRPRGVMARRIKYTLDPKEDQ